MDTKTCQICGRQIKASKGLIAHHGYKRPAGKGHNGYGWQTASCMGARHLPYEISCDVIPVAISKVEKHIEDTRIRLNFFMSNPPEMLSYQRGSYGQSKQVSRPHDFVAEKNSRVSRFHQPDERNYVYEFDNRVRELSYDIEGSKQTLEFLKERLSNWKKTGA